MNRRRDAGSLLALAFIALFVAVAGLLTRPQPVTEHHPTYTGGIDVPIVGAP